MGDVFAGEERMTVYRFALAQSALTLLVFAVAAALSGCDSGGGSIWQESRTAEPEATSSVTRTPGAGTPAVRTPTQQNGTPAGSLTPTPPPTVTAVLPARTGSDVEGGRTGETAHYEGRCFSFDYPAGLRLEAEVPELPQDSSVAEFPNTLRFESVTIETPDGSELSLEAGRLLVLVASTDGMTSHEETQVDGLPAMFWYAPDFAFTEFHAGFTDFGIVARSGDPFALDSILSTLRLRCYATDSTIDAIKAQLPVDVNDSVHISFVDPSRAPTAFWVTIDAQPFDLHRQEALDWLRANGVSDPEVELPIMWSLAVLPPDPDRFCPVSDSALCDAVYGVDDALAAGDPSLVASQMEFAPCVSWTTIGATANQGCLERDDVIRLFRGELNLIPYRVIGFGVTDDEATIFVADPTKSGADITAMISLYAHHGDGGWVISAGSIQRRGYTEPLFPAPSVAWPPTPGR